MPMLPHSLYSSEDHSIVLIDVPYSIAAAQATSLQLRSVPALAKPYETPEPKGEKRGQVLAAVPLADRQYDISIQSLLAISLEQLHQGWNAQEWCLSRECIDPELTRNLVGSGHVRDHHVDRDDSIQCSPPLILSTSPNLIEKVECLRNTIVYNPYDQTANIATSNSGSFRIPPYSTFLSSTIEAGRRVFSEAVQYLLSNKKNVKGTFHLVLMDPPWANRSVRHCNAYISAEQLASDPFEQTLPILTEYLAVDGYVAVWITNKAKIRNQVLKALNRLGLNLVEEWIWLKVTVVGEPITPLDGLWRKPYETLLLFSRRPMSGGVERRVILAVPDVHSRKPNLRFMFEQILPEQYHALELFARSLTAKWWSWGDEVLKFQHENNWTSNQRTLPPTPDPYEYQDGGSQQQKQ